MEGACALGFKGGDATSGPADGSAREVYEIDNPATLRVVYDPLRFRILMLTAKPRSVTELADAVGVPRGRLYYHVHQLEEQGLLEVAAERTVGTRVERSYQARYSSFRLSPDLRGHPLARSHAPFLRTMHDLVDKHLDAVAVGAQTPGLQDLPTMCVSHQRRLPRQRAEEFLERLTDLIDEFFTGSGTDARDGVSWYAALCLIAPVEGPFDDDHSVELRLGDGS